MTKLDNRVESTENLFEVMNFQYHLIFCVLHSLLFFSIKVETMTPPSLIDNILKPIFQRFFICFDFTNPCCERVSFNFQAELAYTNPILISKLLLIYLNRWHSGANRLYQMFLYSTMSTWLFQYLLHFAQPENNMEL